MGRPVMLGNGALTVGLNEFGLVNDFYYPFVGLDNLTNARITNHKIGVWVDNKFSWVDDGNWIINVKFDADALISDVTFENHELNLAILSKDFVDSDLNVFCRQLTVSNLVDSKREVRLFMHQVFMISRSGRADTGLYEPDGNYILDYKGRCSLLIYACQSKTQSFDQFAIGSYGIEGKEGTYKDAEDGELSNSPVEHGGIDTVLRIKLDIEANAPATVDYWVIATDSQYAGEKIQNIMLKDGVSERMQLTRIKWHDWLDTGSDILSKLDDVQLDAVQRSLMIIKAHIDKRGGIIASCDSSIYNYGRDYYSYVWPRDGAYAIWPLIRLGYSEEAKNFFNFCRDILNTDGYLMHKYQPDRAIGSTWHPLLHGRHKELAIQEDETAIVIYMLMEYWKHTKDEDFVNSLYDTLIKPAANFMAQFIDDQTALPHATYDLWEEKFLTTTYTTAVVYRALLDAVNFAEMFEHPDDIDKWKKAAERILGGMPALFDNERKLYRKGLLLNDDGNLTFDNTLDVSSMYGIMIYEPKLDPEMLKQTVAAIENIMLDKSPSGGSPRYEHDNYFASNPPFLGNPWFVTTLWIAQYYIRDGQTDKATHYIDWTLKHAFPSGVLAEQVNPNNGDHVSVAPLVWSHAELINTILDLKKVEL